LENLPVATPPGKSCPYGGKLAFAAVNGRLLVLPGSTMESPNTKMAGIFGRRWSCVAAAEPPAAAVAVVAPSAWTTTTTSAAAVATSSARTNRHHGAWAFPLRQGVRD
jgi:hypothetical protein